MAAIFGNAISTVSLEIKGSPYMALKVFLIYFAIFFLKTIIESVTDIGDFSY